MRLELQSLKSKSKEKLRSAAAPAASGSHNKQRGRCSKMLHQMPAGRPYLESPTSSPEDLILLKTLPG